MERRRAPSLAHPLVVGGQRRGVTRCRYYYPKAFRQARLQVVPLASSAVLFLLLHSKCSQELKVTTWGHIILVK